MRKLTKEKNRVQKDRADLHEQMAQHKATVQKHLKKKDVLAMMSTQLLKQSCDLYLQHEIMLDDEKDKRAALSTQF